METEGARRTKAGSAGGPAGESLGVLDASLECLKELAALRAWVDAQEAKVVARIAGAAAGVVAGLGDTGVVGKERAASLAAAEVAVALRVPERTAAQVVEQSRMLVEDFPATLVSLELGCFSRRHAVTVVQECCGIPVSEVPGFEAELLGVAGSTTVARLRDKARRLRERLHPEALRVRRERKVRERTVVVEPDVDGMAWLSAYLPAEQAYGIQYRVEVTARGLQGPGESRLLPQLRADVFADLLTHTCATDPTTGSRGAGGPAATGATTGSRTTGSRAAGGDGVPGYRGVAARVLVTVPVLTLLGGDGPGDLDGYGPIDPDTARRLAGHAGSFTRVLTDPESGAVLSVGRTRYRPPKDLQDWVRVRDNTCRHPGCNRPARVCEIDHTLPWSQGGQTSAGNLAALCRKHHLFKSEGFWGYRQPVEGTIVARSLAGKTYTTTPEPPPF
jgi:hypothetical protein